MKTRSLLVFFIGLIGIVIPRWWDSNMLFATAFSVSIANDYISAFCFFAIILSIIIEFVSLFFYFSNARFGGKLMLSGVILGIIGNTFFYADILKMLSVSVFFNSLLIVVALLGIFSKPKKA